MEVKLYKDEAEILKGIDSISKMGETLKNTIHRAGVSVLSLWVNGKIDADKACQLVTGIQGVAGYHAKAFADWVAMMTDMHWAEATETWFAHKDTKITKGQFLAAKSKPFWEVTPPQRPKPMSLAAELLKVLEKAKKHQKDGKQVEGDDIPNELLKRINSVMATWEAEKNKAEV